MLQLAQSWKAHFSKTATILYGSPSDHPFDWTVFWKNWDTTLPVALALVLYRKRIEFKNWLIFPVAWLVLTLLVFGIHRPWWSYYFVHNAIPMCWLGSIGFVFLLQKVYARQSLGFRILALLFGVGAIGWMGTRVFLQIKSIQDSPQIFSSLLLKQIQKIEPPARFIYSVEPIYSFQSGIPFPPALAVVSRKRFWSGQMTFDRLIQDIEKARPEVMILANDGQESALEELVFTKYQLKYEDSSYRLYTIKIPVGSGTGGQSSKMENL
jgi:hypothetical protein